jgi:hypothetical protein
MMELSFGCKPAFLKSPREIFVTMFIEFLALLMAV